MGKDVGQKDAEACRRLEGREASWTWKMEHRRAVGGGFWRKIVMLNYTYLHAFTRFYTMFLAVNVNVRNGVLESWSVGGAMGRIGQMGRMWAQVGKGGLESGLKWEKAVGKRSVEPSFPTFSRLNRRKWLISSVYAA